MKAPLRSSVTVQRVALHPEGVDRNDAVTVNGGDVMEVALHPEGVDRNGKIIMFSHLPREVALHPEGVDRNGDKSAGELPRLVALHPEGVDRNQASGGKSVIEYTSPSTRRAWIEIV